MSAVYAQHKQLATKQLTGLLSSTDSQTERALILSAHADAMAAVSAIFIDGPAPLVVQHFTDDIVPPPKKKPKAAASADPIPQEPPAA